METFAREISADKMIPQGQMVYGWEAQRCSNQCWTTIKEEAKEKFRLWLPENTFLVGVVPSLLCPLPLPLQIVLENEVVMAQFPSPRIALIGHLLQNDLPLI